MSMDLDGKNKVKLLTGSFSYVSATPLGIFCTNPDAQNLELISLDGKTRTLLGNHTCGRFCVSSNWIVYENRDDDNHYWIMRLDGSEDHALAR